MKIKDINITHVISKQMDRSGIYHTDFKQHIKRATRVLRHFRNKKVDRLTYHDVLNFVERQSWMELEKQEHIYSTSLFLDSYQNKLSTKCTGLVLQCPNCQSKARLVNRTEVDSTAKKNTMIYLCDNFYNGHCRSWVSVHEGDNFPLGIPGDDTVRKLRVDIHEAIDNIWRYGLCTRDELYSKLAKLLDVSIFHIGLLDRQQCKKVMDSIKWLY